MAYMFVHFIGEQEGGEQIYFSVSRDGLFWEDLCAGPILVSNVGECGVRDPFIVRSEIDGLYRILATDLRIASGKGWNVAQYSGSLNLIVWTSADLIHWNEPECIYFPELQELKAGCLWAPEAIYDKERDAYFVYWASMIEGRQKMHGAWTRDFRKYEGLHCYIEKNTHIIDTTMAEEDGNYYRFSACGDYPAVMMEKGDSVDAKAWSYCMEHGVPGSERMEGPIIYYLKEQKKWCLMADDVTKRAGYVPFLSDSLKNPDFRRLASDEYHMGPRRKRHGSVLEISEEEYEKLKSIYGTY